MAVRMNFSSSSFFVHSFHIYIFRSFHFPCLFRDTQETDRLRSLWMSHENNDGNEEVRGK